MKSTVVPSPLSLNVVLVAVMFLAVVLVAVGGRRMLFIPNIRVAMAALLVLGMTMRALGGISFLL